MKGSGTLRTRLYACPNGPRVGGALGAFLSASDNFFLLAFAVSSCFFVNLRADNLPTSSG